MSDESSRTAPARRAAYGARSEAEQLQDVPGAYHINTDDGLITVQVEGRVDAADLTRLGRSLLADSDYDPEFPQLIDLRGLRPDPRGDLETLTRFVHQDYRRRVGGSVAVVIDEHLESRHCADIFLLTCAIHEAELFAEYDQALKWLMRRAFAGATAAGSAEEHDAAGHDPDQAPE